MKRILTSLTAFVMLFANIAVAKNQLLPLEAFASIPDVSHVTMSPNGKLIASLVRLNTDKQQGAIINILDIDTRESIFPVQTDNEKFVILSMSWASDDLLLVEAKFPAVRYGTPTTETRIITYSVSKKKSRIYSAVLVLKSLSGCRKFNPTLLITCLMMKNIYCLVSMA
ncbi:hypothetical protein [Shewanella sp. ENK2]|uniref:hypothetical protein n=1 Tax=Shewanella sp. ENK2 TaxID=2775245 RepID=UPI003748A5E1